MGHGFAVVGLLVVALGVGCVQRTITITSEPSEALVYLNDEEVGRTPVTVPFTFYGTYDVRLEREGCTSLWTTKRAKAPWWEAPGPDLIAEAIPGMKAEQHWHFEMQVPGEVDEDRLIDRAIDLEDTLYGPSPLFEPPPEGL